MKMFKRFAAALLAGVMVLAMLTACGGGGNTPNDPNDPGNPDFEAKVELAYMAKLNETFDTTFKNDDAIKNLAVKHIKEMSGKQTLNSEESWATAQPTTTTINQVMICFDPNQSTEKEYVKLYYEADKAATIVPDDANIGALKLAYETVQAMAAQKGVTIKLSSLGVGAKTIGGKTYVAIGYELSK